MNFDDYLTEYYGFNTQDRIWQRMGNVGKNMLRSSYKSDMANLEKGPEPSPKVAALPQTQDQ